jgi:hypothetical protein
VSGLVLELQPRQLGCRFGEDGVDRVIHRLGHETSTVEQREQPLGEERIDGSSDIANGAEDTERHLSAAQPCKLLPGQARVGNATQEVVILVDREQARRAANDIECDTIFADAHREVRRVIDSKTATHLLRDDDNKAISIDHYASHVSSYSIGLTFAPKSTPRFLSEYRTSQQTCANARSLSEWRTNRAPSPASPPRRKFGCTAVSTARTDIRTSRPEIGSVPFWGPNVAPQRTRRTALGTNRHDARIGLGCTAVSTARHDIRTSRPETRTVVFWGVGPNASCRRRVG